MFLKQMDVTTTFLHGNIDDTVSISPPCGLDICPSGKALQLLKGWYGLKQSTRLWNDKWKIVMDAMGFKSPLSDECVSVRRGVWLLIYVDKIIPIGPNINSVMM